MQHLYGNTCGDFKTFFPQSLFWSVTVQCKFCWHRTTSLNRPPVSTDRIRDGPPGGGNGLALVVFHVYWQLGIYSLRIVLYPKLNQYLSLSTRLGPSSASCDNKSLLGGTKATTRAPLPHSNRRGTNNNAGVRPHFDKLVTAASEGSTPSVQALSLSLSHSHLLPARPELVHEPAWVALDCITFLFFFSRSSS